MKNKYIICISAFMIVFMPGSLVNADGNKYVTARPLKSEGIYGILGRYHLPTNRKYIEMFRELNAEKLSKRNDLQLGNTYKLPILIFKFNGKTIRSSIGINDYARAKRIENYNKKVLKAGLKNKSYKISRILWVPMHEMVPEKGKDQITQLSRKFTTSPEINSKLNGHIFYLVSGHGGPDPGAVGKYNGHKLYEDEYAYDITLRLANRLQRYGAKVYMIVQDPNDGIRNDMILPGDRDEYYYGHRKISRNKKERLRQRTKIINKLYAQNKKSAIQQKVIIFHCDSRSYKEQIDIFFYHSPGSRSGRRVAKILHTTLENNYRKYQPRRGYRGTVTSRSLYVLRRTFPTAVYIELGNIRNTKDQKRFILGKNRQAVAYWLCEGLMKAAGN